MFDALKIPQIEHHLKSISKIFKLIKQDEIQIHCPFCDDATRPNAMRHGHLYLSTTQCVFYCFRCTSSGTLLRLLIETGFEDDEIINLIGKNVRYNFRKDYFSTKKTKSIDIKTTITNYINKVIKENYTLFLYFQHYIFKRLGENINFKDFLITPDFLMKQPCCNFYNLEGEMILSRLINPSGKFRFKLNEQSSGLYYFQKMNFTKKNRIILTEGPFDLLNLFLYSPYFPSSECIFISISGKKYISVIERLILSDLLIGEYEINLIFDKDNFSYQKYIYKSQKMCEILNSDISIKGYLPIISKDTGDFPAIEEV